MENKGNIRLVNIKKDIAPYDIYIGRANRWLGLEESKWHNPFPLKREGDRPKIIEQVEEYFRSRQDLIDALPELKDKTLGCYCYNSDRKEGKHCHGHVLIKLYNEFVK
jgi:hypothetical protein